MTQSKVVDVTLPSSLTMGNVEDLQTELVQFLDSPTCRIDAEQLTSVDTAGLQLLAAMFQSVPASEWFAVSRVLYDAAATLGLLELLRLRDVEPVDTDCTDEDADDLCPVF